MEKEGHARQRVVQEYKHVGGNCRAVIMSLIISILKPSPLVLLPAYPQNLIHAELPPAHPILHLHLVGFGRKLLPGVIMTFLFMSKPGFVFLELQ